LAIEVDGKNDTIIIASVTKKAATAHKTTKVSRRYHAMNRNLVAEVEVLVSLSMSIIGSTSAPDFFSDIFPDSNV
jgi:hypothetical protein